LAREVAARLRASYNWGGLANGLWARLGRRAFASGLPNIVKGALYSVSLMIDAVREPGNPMDNLVQDRYWPSLMAYALSSYPRPMSSLIVAPSRWYIRFHVNIHVVCSPEERERRSLMRSAADRADQSVLRNPRFAQRYEAELDRIMNALPNYMRLDTTGRTVEESVAMALAHIEARGAR